MEPNGRAGQCTSAHSASNNGTVCDHIPNTLAGDTLACVRCDYTERVYISEANEAASFAGSLLRSLKTRFVNVKMCLLLVLATLVDPHYKAIFHSAPSEKVWTSSLLLSEVEKLHPTGTEEARENESTASTKKEACSVWAAFSKVKMASEQKTAVSWHVPAQETGE